MPQPHRCHRAIVSVSSTDPSENATVHAEYQRETFRLEVDHWWYRARQEIILAQFRNRYPTRRDLRILDVGCGAGTLLKSLRRFGQVTGLEASAAAAAAARRRSGCDVRVGTIPIRDERPGVASVVTVFAVTGAVLAQFNGTDLVWTHVTVGATRQPVARITLENNFAGGAPFRTAIDDLRYCATPLVGTNYCGPAVPNSSGMPGAIAVRGTTTAAFNSLTLIAEHLPADQFGYFLNSHTQGFIQPAGSQGNLCLGGAIGRHSANVASSGADGVLVLVLDLTAIPTPSGPVSVLPGQTWNFQAWHRDVNPGMTSNFTDGASVSFN